MANKFIKLLFFKSLLHFRLFTIIEYRLQYSLLFIVRSESIISLLFWEVSNIDYIFTFLGGIEYRFNLYIFEYRFATLDLGQFSFLLIGLKVVAIEHILKH